MSEWEKCAKEVEEVFGAEFDRDEGYFTCPYCFEPLYKDDYQDGDFYDANLKGALVCPICGEVLYGL